MAKKQVQVEVSVSSYDLGQGLRSFVGDLRKALADGFQPGKDLPDIAIASYQDLLSKLGALSDLKGDLAEDHVAFAQGWELAGAGIAKDLGA